MSLIQKSKQKQIDPNTSIKYKCGHKENIPIFVKFDIDLVFFLHWKEKTGFCGSKKECFNCFIDRVTSREYVPTLISEQQKANGFAISESGELIKIGNWDEEIKGWKYTNSRFRIFLKSKCEICGSKLDLTIHHINPQKNGGLDLWWNLQTLCDSCHLALEKEIQLELNKCNTV